MDTGTGTASQAPRSRADADVDEEDDFTRLYEQRYAGITRYLLRRGVGHTAPDLAAEVFVVAWRRRSEWQPLPDDRRVAWLYGVARLLLANARRSEQRSVGLVERVGRDHRRRGADQHADHSDLTVEQIVVAEALARLSEADQELIRLIAWDGLGPAQAAEVLGCRAGTVTTRLNRARNRLKKLIDSNSPRG